MNNIDSIEKNLYQKYRKLTLSKKEFAKEMGIGLSTLNKYLANGMGVPNYIKMGNASNSRVLFNIHDVAEFLSNTVKVA